MRKMRLAVLVSVLAGICGTRGLAVPTRDYDSGEFW